MKRTWAEVKKDLLARHHRTVATILAEQIRREDQRAKALTERTGATRNLTLAQRVAMDMESKEIQENYHKKQAAIAETVDSWIENRANLQEPSGTTLREAINEYRARLLHVAQAGSPSAKRTAEYLSLCLLKPDPDPGTRVPIDDERDRW